MKQFKDKTAIVTGGAAGIGRGLCEELASAGAVVVIADINEEGAHKAAQEMSSSGGRVVGKRLDVTRDEEIERVVDETIEEYGRLDYMFNNAGIALMGEVRDMTLDQARRLVDVNIHGAINGTIIAYKRMVAQGFGHIVNVGSVTGIFTWPTQTQYSATKHAVQAFSTGLRAEGAALGVKVSVICPMNIKSNMAEGSITILGIEDSDWFSNLPARWMDANVAAKKMLRGVARNKGIIVVPSHARILWWLFRIHPGLFDRTVGTGMVNWFRKSRDKEE
jgi:NAD(P)-dependent dehydrogenase (short-subunit alcohol dehydrogenase family)